MLRHDPYPLIPAGDGLLTAVRLAAFEVLDQRSILFNDCADRVALLMRLRLRAPAPTPGCRPGSLVWITLAMHPARMKACA